MTTGLTMHRCAECGHVSFPLCSFCAICHFHEFVPVDSTVGTVEELTVRAGVPEITFASIRTDLGPVIVAAVHGRDICCGSRVVVTSDSAAQIAEQAIAYVPVPLPTDTEN